ncbi:MAG: PAS domain-containing protein, partial [Candidatus Thiodiazotropha sp.]
IREALVKTPKQRINDTGFNTMYSQMAELFKAFAQTRSEYMQLRLIGIANGGREIVRVDRDETGIVIAPPGSLQRRENRDYVQQASMIQDGQVALSRIDLIRDHSHISRPETVTIRAVSPVRDSNGNVFALVVINLNMNHVFDLMRAFLPDITHFYLVNQEGFFLCHPDIAKTMTFVRPEPYRVQDEFPDHAKAIAALKSDTTLHFDFGSGDNLAWALATKRRFETVNGNFRELTLILTEPSINARHEINMARTKNYLAVLLLMGVVILLVVLITRRQTRSLRDLVRVSQAVSHGDYEVELPKAPGREMTNLSNAFRHMITTLKHREQQLKELNLTLERQVDERTHELEVSRAALTREQLLLQSILEHVGDGVVATDGNGKFLLWNRRAEEMLGMGPVDLSQEEWSRHYGLYRAPDSDLLPLTDLPLARAMRGEIVRNQELFVCNPHNRPGCWISAFARPLSAPEGGNPEGAVAVLVDITEERKLRDQMDTQTGELAKIGRLTLIAQIVDTMAHRLSQPLAAIANYAGAAIQLRATGNLDDKRLDEVLSLISRQAERGGECLRDLRSLRMRGVLPHGRSDINQIIESALSLLDDRFQRMNIQVQRQFASDLPPLFGQKMELQQALVHLLMNAMESLSTTGNQPRILRLVTAFNAEDNLLRIEVGDNGPGVPSALREHVFEAWFTTKPDSLGLGLSVAESIIENHNGSLSIIDSDDHMTWFLIELPAIDDTDE